MQYHIQTLAKHLFDKDSFEQVTLQELKQFTEEYPYAAVGQFLYAKKLKDSGSYNNYEQSEQASLYFHNALWLRWQLDQKEEAPALMTAKAEELPPQPGFRIVVQMPKPPNIITTKPPAEPEENKEAEPAIAATNEEAPVAAAPTSETVPEETRETAEHQNNLQVNENGALVEQPAEPAPAEQAPPAREETTTPETASAVAIAESSQLAEETIAAEAAVNAVSITEEVLTPAAGTPETTVPESAPVNEETDDIVPAIEITKQELENTPVDDDIIPAVEVTREELAAIAPVEEQPVEETPPAEVTAEVAETPRAESYQGPAEIAIEEQLVEEIAEVIPAQEPVLTAETEQPATAEEVVDNTIDRTVTPEPDIAPSPLPEGAGERPDKAAVDLGEPIFESYHTIDYFASQGIKLGQEDFKDRLGKQLKSFTDWLRSMKRISPEPNTSLDEVTNQSIQRIAEHSVEEKEVLTEAMAEVWAKQGNADKAIRVYEKLSLLNPAKSPYFAGRIEQLKAQ